MMGIIGILLCLVPGLMIGVFVSDLQRVQATGITRYGTRMRKKDIVLTKFGIFICSLLLFAGFVMAVCAFGG